MKRTKAQAGKLAVTKGKAFERSVVRILRDAGLDVRRNVSQSRSAKREGPDILGIPVWLELCHSKQADPRKKWDQALADQTYSHAPSYTWPIVVVWKRDGMREIQASATLGEWCAMEAESVDSRALATLSLTDAIHIIKRHVAREAGQ